MRVTEPSLRKKYGWFRWPNRSLVNDRTLLYTIGPKRTSFGAFRAPLMNIQFLSSCPCRKFHLSLHDPSLLAFITWSTSWFVLSRIGLVDVQIMPYLSNSLDQYSLARFFEGYRRYWDQPQVIHWVYLHPILAMTKWLSPLHALRRQCRVLQ